MDKRRNITALLLVAALCFGVLTGAFMLPDKMTLAAENQSVKITSKAFKKASVNLAIYINGQKISQKGFKVSGKRLGEKDTFIYVPVKAFAEALGIDFSQKKKNVTLKAGDSWKVTFKSGKDGYEYIPFDGASDVIPCMVFGKSVTKNDILYAPIDVFSSLGMFSGMDIGYLLDGKKLEVSGKNTEDQNGEWEISESPVITKKISKLVKSAKKEYSDFFDVTAVALVSKQVDEGTNYGLLCRMQPQGKTETYAFAVLIEDLDGNARFKQIVDTGIETNINNALGGWSQPSSVEIPSEYLPALEAAMAKVNEMSFKPMALVSMQVVNGMNACIFSSFYTSASSGYAFVYVYFDPLTGKGEITDIKYYTGDEKITEYQFDYSAATENDYLRRTDGTYEAFTELGLAAALEEGVRVNGEWGDPDFRFTEVAVKNDIVISHEISTLGIVLPDDGVNIVIENGGILQAEIEIKKNSMILVHSGGKLWTTQGGELCIRNYGQIVVEEGGELRSMFGGTINNYNSIVLNGNFYCGCVRYEGNSHVWFTNTGKVTGNGKAIVYGMYFDQNDPIDMEYCRKTLKSTLGKKTKIDVSIDAGEPEWVGAGE